MYCWPRTQATGYRLQATSYKLQAKDRLGLCGVVVWCTCTVHPGAPVNLRWFDGNLKILKS